MTQAPAQARPGPRGWQAEMWGGFAAMLVALPSAIAYGVASYAPLGTSWVATGAIAGILGSIAFGLVAPLLGGAPRLISAPCAPAAAVLAALSAGLLAGTAGSGAHLTPEQVLAALTVVALLSGLLQLLYGALGGGKLIKFIPYPVVSGYLSGVGVIIFTTQVPKFFGLEKSVPVLHGLVSPEHWRWESIVVGLCTVLGTILAPKVTKALPAPVLGLALGMLAYFGIGLGRPELLTLQNNHLVVGPIAAGGGSLFAGTSGRLAGLMHIGLGDVHALLVPALTLSALLSIDTLKTCVVMDALTRSRHNSNRELLAQGLSNIASALIGGMPGSGTMGPTLVNVNSGAKTRLSGILQGAFVVVVALLLSRLVAWVPIAGLAGILFVVAWRMFDKSCFKLLRQGSTVLDFVVIAAVIITAVGYSLVAAAGVGLLLAILLFMREQMRSSVICRKVYGHQMSSKKHRLDSEKELLVEAGQQVAICELQGSLFFGTTDRLFTELEQDLHRCRYLVLDMRRVVTVDYTGAHMLDLFEAQLAEHGGRMLLSGLPAQLPSGQDLEGYFAHLGVTRQSKQVRVFDTLNDALEWVEDQLLDELRTPESMSGRALGLAEFELFREFEEDQTLEALRECITEASFPAGETIFGHGDAGAEAYLIRRGEVRVFVPLASGKQLTLATYGRGHFFGDMAFLDRRPRSAQAVTTADTDLYVLHRGRFDEMARGHEVAAIKTFARLACTLAQRLRHTDAELRALQDA